MKIDSVDKAVEVLNITHDLVGTSARLLLLYFSLPHEVRHKYEHMAIDAAQSLQKASDLWYFNEIVEGL